MTLRKLLDCSIIATPFVAIFIGITYVGSLQEAILVYAVSVILMGIVYMGGHITDKKEDGEDE